MSVETLFWVLGGLIVWWRALAFASWLVMVIGDNKNGDTDDH